MLKYTNAEVVFREIPDEITLAINISGCPNHCKGCHSPHLWDNIGEDLTPNILVSLIKQHPECTCVCLMGGDQDPDEVMHLIDSAKTTIYVQGYKQPLRFGWYSGRYTIPNNWQQLDYLKLGPYIAEKGPLDSPQTNQILFQVKGSVYSPSLVNITSKFWIKAHDSESCD